MFRLEKKNISLSQVKNLLSNLGLGFSFGKEQKKTDSL